MTTEKRNVKYALKYQILPLIYLGKTIQLNLVRY